VMTARAGAAATRVPVASTEAAADSTTCRRLIPKADTPELTRMAAIIVERNIVADLAWFDELCFEQFGGG
jgi:hypothetical protein